MIYLFDLQPHIYVTLKDTLEEQYLEGTLLRVLLRAQFAPLYSFQGQCPFFYLSASGVVETKSKLVFSLIP